MGDEENLAVLEWWHFPVGTPIEKRTFGRLICELGWTQETLIDEPQPYLNYSFGIGYPQSARTDPAG